MKEYDLFVNVNGEIVPIEWTDELNVVIDPYKDFKNKIKQQVKDYYNGRMAYFDDLSPTLNILSSLESYYRK